MVKLIEKLIAALSIRADVLHAIAENRKLHISYWIFLVGYSRSLCMICNFLNEFRNLRNQPFLSPLIRLEVRSY